jgi:hypothetical protein
MPVRFIYRQRGLQIIGMFVVSRLEIVSPVKLTCRENPCCPPTVKAVLPDCHHYLANFEAWCQTGSPGKSAGWLMLWERGG